MRSAPSPVAIDIFCGPGGLSEGFRKAGFNVAVAVDADREATATYKRNHKTVVINRKISQISADDIFDVAVRNGHSQIDVVIGGPPCRGISQANQRSAGYGNPHNKLFWSYVNLVCKIKPKAFVLENVAQLYYFDSGKFLARLEKRFRKHGYTTFKAILNAADYGVPQLRRRTFLVGTLGQEFTFPRPTFVQSNYVTVRDAIGDLPSLDNEYRDSEVMDYLHTPFSDYQVKMRRGSKLLYNHVTTRSRAEVVKRFRRIPPGYNWKKIKDLLRKNAGYKLINRTHSCLYRRFLPSHPSSSLANPRKNLYIHPYEDRILSVREVARLQSFSDKYIFEGGLASMQQQVADAVPVLLARAVASSLRKTCFKK